MGSVELGDFGRRNGEGVPYSGRSIKEAIDAYKMLKSEQSEAATKASAASKAHWDSLPLIKKVSLTLFKATVPIKPWESCRACKRVYEQEYRNCQSYHLSEDMLYYLLDDTHHADNIINQILIFTEMDEVHQLSAEQADFVLTFTIMLSFWNHSAPFDSDTGEKLYECKFA